MEAWHCAVHKAVCVHLHACKCTHGVYRLRCVALMERSDNVLCSCSELCTQMNCHCEMSFISLQSGCSPNVCSQISALALGFFLKRPYQNSPTNRISGTTLTNAVVTASLQYIASGSHFLRNPDTYVLLSRLTSGMADTSFWRNCLHDKN